MTSLQIMLLVVSGILAGFINTLAGGGSVISLSVFMFLGLPPQMANGTTRIAVLFQTLASAGSFRQAKVLNIKDGTRLAIPAVVGSVIGAQLAIDINEQVFKKIIAFLLFAVLIMMFIKPSQWIKGKETTTDKRPGWLQIVVFFGIGLYGGFLQAGVGYFLLAAIVLGAGYDLVKGNAIKVWIVMLYTPFALFVFFLNGQIDWRFGLIHAIGNIIGALIAARMAVKQGAKFVRWVIVVFILVTAADLSGLISIKSWFI
ncbi:MAG: sulfite exporter TauE/SafE family protein [Bacteroidales bacterium]|nr:sulfite exporter TauE/SafE family protein [Bacteroidales bacterium]MDZ4205052.1 sulfite exporter TauE/SafE family protein [Bacteroidales bacterium]